MANSIDKSVLQAFLKLKSIQEHELSITCSDAFFLVLHSRITHFDRVAMYLALTETEIEHIRRDKDNEKSRIMAVLWEWRRKNGGNASYLVLVRTFLHMDDRVTAEFITGYVRENYLNVTTVHPRKQPLFTPERAPGKYGNWRKLNENEREQVINDLQEEEKEIRKKFLFLFLKILELFEKRQIDVLKMKIFVQSLFYGSICVELDAADNLSKVFYFLIKHCSWFNFELFEEAVRYFGDDSEKSLMSSYIEDTLKPFLERSIFEIPPESFSSCPDESTVELIRFKLPDDLTPSGSDVKRFQSNLAKRIGLKSSVFQFRSYYNGCIELEFAVDKIIPKSNLQELYSCVRLDSEKEVFYLTLDTNTIVPTHSARRSFLSRMAFWKHSSLSKQEASPVEVIPRHAKIELKLRYKAEDVLIIYGNASLPQHPPLIPWCCLKFKDETPPPKDYHMVYHKLSVSRGQTIESVEFVIQKYSKQVNLKALLITADIEQKKLNMLKTTCSFTVVIIPKMYKHDIGEYLQSADESLEATIAPLYSERRDGGTTGTVLDAFLPKAPTEVTAFITRMCSIIQEKKCISLAYEPDKKKRCLQWVLEAIDFTQNVAENEMYTGWQNDMQEIMELLLQDAYFDTMFIQDFPVYFNLAYSVYKHSSQFTLPKNLNMFIKICVTQISRYPVPTIVEKLSIFIEAGDIEIVFSGVRKNTTVFELTAKSFLTVCNEFCRVDSHTSSSHIKLLSTSIAMKLFSLCSKTKKTEKLWHKHFIEHYKSNGISDVDINGLQSGLEAMTVILADHPNLMLSWKDVSCIFTSKVHSITILINFIAICDHYVTRGNGDESFCSDYLKPVTSFYLSKVKKIEQPSSSKSETIHEGLHFLSFLFKLINEHQWSLLNFEIIFEQWVTILVNVIDLSLSNCIQCINLLVNPVELTIWKSYHECLNRQLEIKLKDHCHKMSVENFIAVIDIGSFEKSEIIYNFLGRFSVIMPKTITVTEAPFNSLFTLAITHMTHPKHQEDLLSFFKVVMECYSKTNRSLEFLIDLFQLDIHPSEGFEMKFSITIKEFITDNKLQKAIHDDIVLIISKLSLTENSFLWMTVNTMIKEVFQNDLQFDTDVLDSLSLFCSPDLHEKHIYSVKIRAIFSIFLNMAKDMKLSSDNFHCLQEYSSIINPMAISFHSIWNAFKSWEGVDKEPTIKLFKERVDNIPEFQQFVDGVLNSFKHFVKITGQQIRKWNVTYDDLVVLDTHYEVYEAMLQCVSKVFISEFIVILKEELSDLKKHYNDYVDEINKLLVMSPKNEPELAKSCVQFVLNKYGIEIPPVLDTHLKELLSCNEIPSINGSQIYTVITYQANQSTQLSSLVSLKDSLTTFLEPLKDSLDTLVLIDLKSCQIFEKCINYFLDKQSLTYLLSQQCSQTLFTEPNMFTLDCQKKMIQLNDAVQEAETVVASLKEGNAKMNVIGDIFNSSDLKSIDLSVENKSLQHYFKLKIGREVSVDISNSFTALLELHAVYKHIFALQKTCELFGLYECLTDPKMIQLIKIANEVDEAQKASEFESPNTHYITSSDACVKVSTIKDIFGLGDIIDNPCFNLFSLLQHGCPLYDFAQERGYNLSNGMETFHQEYQLVTADLLHEDHQEELLAVLLGAMQLTSCFFDESCFLLDLWTSINKISNVSTATVQLKTVNEEIGLIRIWFNRVSEGSQEINENTLQCILCSGSYHFFCDGYCVEVKLQFNLSCENQRDQPLKEWSSIKTKDFIRQLTLINSEIQCSDDQVGTNFRWFQEFNIAAMELQNCYSQLQCYGHPLYLKASSEQYLLYPLREGWQALTAKVKASKNQLIEFMYVFHESRKNFPLLSFVSTQKLKAIYADMKEEISYFDYLLRDVGFLFNLDINSCHVIRKELSKYHQAVRNTINEVEHPAKIIGNFLSKLVNQPELKPYLSAAVLPQKGNHGEDTITISLISAFDYSNLDLIRLIYWSFDKRFPLFCQLFRCSSNTCKEDIELFFDRIDHFPQPKYLVLGINLIRNDLQQVFLKRFSKLKSNVHRNSDHFRTIDIFVIEYSPSLFRHIPWIATTTKMDKDKLPYFNDIYDHLRKQKIGKEFKQFQVVYGLPGSGKTHYIKNCLDSEFHDKTSMVISINETFNKTNVVQRLIKLKHGVTTFDLALFLNINLIWPQKWDREEYKKVFYQLVDDVHWFFFDYFILSYVDVPENTSADSTSPGCLSLPLVAGASMSVYVEAPYWNIVDDHYTTDKEYLDQSYERFKDLFPVFVLLGEKITPSLLFDVHNNPGVQLVCKYIVAYREKRLDHIIKKTRDAPIKINKIMKDIPPSECQRVLYETFPIVEVRGKKIMEVLYLRYMERRCIFLENCPHLETIRNKEGRVIEERNTAKIRSTLFAIMHEEIGNFCKQSLSSSSDVHRQLIYGFNSGGSTFRLFCTYPERLPPDVYSKYQAIGIDKETLDEQLSTQLLHDYLSAALNVDKNQETQKIELIKEKKFVLTRDFVQKMLIIHERKECGIPVVIEGETGVGKTFLLELLACLWNESWNQQLKKQRQNMKEFLLDIIYLLKAQDSTAGRLLNTTLSKLQMGNEKVPLNDLQQVLRLCDPNTPSKQLFEIVRSKVDSYDPVLSSLVLPSDSTYKNEVVDLLEKMQQVCDVETMAEVLNGILYGCLKSTFYKLSIHTAMKPEEIRKFFHDVSQHAESLLTRYNHYLEHRKKVTFKEYQKPIVTVFLDEINTCSCPGYLKEIITDGSAGIRGQKISSNIFIVAVYNPHRGNSLASVEKKSDENWFRSSYYVQSLPPTLELIKWDYGQLQESQEKEYIREKFILTYNDLSSLEYTFLTEQIAKAQNFIRYCAYKTLVNNKVTDDKAKLCSQSTVSQRDIQRVFTFYDWLRKWFKRPTKYNVDDFSVSCRAVFVALALVYYFRLNDEYRKKFKEEMNEHHSLGEQGILVTFENSLDDEFKWVSEHVDLPVGIAPTDALKENIYAIIVCTMTRIPLIIVGPPGSSKTLSFKIVTSNFQGQESKWKNDIDILLRLDPHFYQCSRSSTSTEIETVFQRAENRQKTFDEGSIRSQSVVLMDEAGLAEDSHESLKVLHYYLDNPNVSFVGITNKFLDAAKSNRAVCVFRSETSHNDLVQLAKYSLTHGQAPKATSMMEEHVIDGFVKVYKRMMTKPEFKDFFGLRDFIHFFTYFNQVKSENDIISPEAIVQSLERNFSGTEHFQEILRAFLEVIGSTPNQMHNQSIVEILRSSFIQNEKDLSAENLTRYKLLIDSSEDLSLVRLLFAFNILNRDDTRILSCSKLPGDSESQKLNITEAIIHSVVQGHTVLIHQADEIQEYFYDLFNHRFTCIKNQSSTSFYASVAVGPNIHPTRVSPQFNCVMIISSSELPKMEKPFLNRFEKYALSHDVLFREVLSSCPKSIESLLKYAKNNIDDFVKSCRESSFYGFVKHTIDSLMLSFTTSLSSDDCSHILVDEDEKHDTNCQCATNKEIFVKSLVKHFYDCFGMHIKLGECSKFSNTVEYVFNAIPIDDTVIEFLSTAKPFDLREYAKQAMNFIKESNIDFSIEPVCATIDNLPILILRELVVVYLHKQLIQLMTPEALVLHSEHLHEYYIQCYLQHQHHFSLGHLIQEENYALGKFLPHFKIKKYLCYTRTSYAILEIIHPHYFWQLKITEEERTKMRELFLIDTQLLYTYVITSTTSQQNINHILKQFFDSEQSEVLVLVADMNELSKDCISHVRLLIEEKEARSKIKANKLIYVLLHFSSNMFYTHCYPSIFLNGWQHIYFDTIGDAKADSHIDIQKWLTYCLLKQKGSSIEHITSHTEPYFVTKSIMITWLHNLLPNISMTIGIKKAKDIDKLCKNKTIHDCWYLLLFGFNNMISDVIIERFSYFWQQDTTNKLSQQAASYSMKYHSSRTLSNTIKTTVESSFKDIVLYLLSIINHTMAIHTVLKCNEDSTGCVVSLFCQILSILPIPKSMEEIKLQLHEFNQRREHSKSNISSPRFPFFISVFQSMEAILNKALNLVISTVSIDDNQQNNRSDPLKLEGFTNTVEKNVTDAVINKMKEIFIEPIHEGDDHYACVRVAIQFMKEHHTVWDTYFHDALSKQMLSRDVGVFSKQFKTQQLMSIKSDDMLEKMASLHYQLRMYFLDSNLLSILKLLDECASRIPACTVPAEFKLQDDTSLFCVVIDMIYTSLLSICVPETPSNSISEIKNLLSLYYRMIHLIKLPLQSQEKISFSLKNKFSFISIAFRIYELISTEEKGVFQTSFEDLIYKVSKKLNLGILLNSHLKVNILVDTVIGVAFNDSDSLHLLLSRTCPQEFHSILEHTIQHYVQYFHNFISHEEVMWIHQVINLSLSSHKGAVVNSFGQFIVKYHFQCLLVYNVQTATSPAILSGQTHPNPLLLFNDRIRIVLNELIETMHQTEKSIYSPTFHRNNSKMQKQYQHALLTEPICDAYFELTLTKLQAREHNLLELVCFYKAISECQGKMKVLLVEKEVVIHVVASSLARIILLDEAERVELAEIDVELNTILNDSNAVSKLNNSINSNAIIFVMRLLQACGSEQNVHTMMVNQFISLLNVFECLRPVNITITQEMRELPLKISSKFLLFLDNTFRTRYSIFNEVHQSTVKIIRTGTKKGIDTLMATALKCYVKKHNKNPLEMMKWTFNMSMFISIYYEVFVKKDMQRRSSVISDVLSRMVSQYVSARYLRYLQWLAAPHTFKVPNASIEKLRHFFVRDEHNRTLVHYLLELVAVVLGSPEHSSHLWTHLIMPDMINMSFVPGSLISTTFVPDNPQQYKQIMSINNDHLYYTSRHGLNWQSLLLNQWMSYGMLCACIVINPEIIKKMDFLHNTSNIDYCLSKVTMLWDKLQFDCNLTREDRDSLVFLCIQNLYEVLSKNTLEESWSKISKEELLSDQSEEPSLLTDESDIIEKQHDKQEEYSEEQKSSALCEYERILHTGVFLPSWKLLKSQKKFENLGNTLGVHMRELSNRVPHLNMQCKTPMESFLLTILSSTNLHNKECHLFVLYQFVLRRPVLNIGAEILPVLIEFYNWIHIHLAHKVTVEIAKQTTTKHILISVLKQFFPNQYQERLDQLRHIIEQCKSIRNHVSNYTVPVIDNDIIFYDLLSTKDGQNILFNMITNIVEMYHKFLMDIRRHCSARKHLMEYFSSCDIKIPLSEITKQTCAFGTARRYDSLDDISIIVMKYHSINESAKKWTNTIHDQTILDDCVPETFYLDGIQDAIIQSYIAHKQFIERESFWKEFVFNKFSPCHQVPQNLLYTSTYGYDETVKQLREYPDLLEENITNLGFDELTFTFHSLNYDSLVCVCGGLCVILKMLLQKVATNGVKALSSLTVEEFLKKYYNSDKGGILDEVGIMSLSPTNLRNGLDPCQYSYICNMPIKGIVALSDKFREWIKIGFYDFCHLYHTMKVPLDNEDIKELIRRQENDKVLKSCIYLLFNYEQMLSLETKSDEKMIELINEEKIDSKDKFTVQVLNLPIHCYVDLQIELRKRLMELSIQQEEKQYNESATQKMDDVDMSGLTSDSGVPSPDMSKLNDVNDVEEKDATCIVPSNDPPLEDTQDDSLAEEASKLSYEDVAEFLEKIGLRSSADIVRENNFTGDIIYLAMNEDSSLEDLGITTAIERLRFRVLFKRELSGTISMAANKFSPKTLADICRSVQKLEIYAQLFEDKEIDGEMLLQADQSVFDELGINSLRKIALLNKCKE